MESDSVTAALLWSISGGVFMILCIMIAITCLLVKKNFQQPSLAALSAATKQRSGSTGKSEMRKQAKLTHALSMDTDQYLQPRTDLPGMKPKVPPFGRPITNLRHSSPSSSVEQHIYDDPDYIQNIAKQGKARNYDSETEYSGSPNSSNYDKIHDYANTKGGVAGLRG